MLPLGWEANRLSPLHWLSGIAATASQALVPLLGSALSRVRVTGVSFKCINIKMKKAWPGLLSFRQAVKLLVSLRTSKMKELSSSVVFSMVMHKSTHGKVEGRVRNTHPVVR